MGIVSSLIKAINASGDSKYDSADGQFMGYNNYPLNKSHNKPEPQSEKTLTYKRINTNENTNETRNCKKK
jgi:hypothetical protein